VLKHGPIITDAAAHPAAVLEFLRRLGLYRDGTADWTAACGRCIMAADQ
jgi:hypothetical protein